MRKRFLAFFLSCALAVSAVPLSGIGLENAWAEETKTGTNVALEATAGASYTWSSSSPTRMNDGTYATGNGDTIWHTWRNASTDENTVEATLTWDCQYELTGTRIMWWADNETANNTNGVNFPKSCELQYLTSDGTWKKINDVGVEGNGTLASNTTWNDLTFDGAVTTTALKLVITRSGSAQNGVGISEWEVTGTRGDDGSTDDVPAEVKNPSNVALEATAVADYSNSGTSAANVNNGYLATTSSTTWNTWKSGGATYPTPISLKWDRDYVLSGMKVVWWADNATVSGSEGVTFPKSCQVQYKDADGNWQTITGMTNERSETVDGVGVSYDTNDGNGLNGANHYWNEVTFEAPVKTRELRLLIERSGTGNNGIGISEWEVTGEKASYALGYGTNIAPAATAEAEYTLASSSVKNVNDGKLPTGDAADGTWCTWKNEGDLEYPTPVTLTWDHECDISSMQVMWWANDAAAGNGVMFPKSAAVQYYDSASDKWIDITDMIDESGNAVTSLGVKYGSASEAGTDASLYLGENNRYWNGVRFKNVIKTSKLRILTDRQDSADAKSGIAIGEWKVFGEENVPTIAEGINIAPKASVTADYSNTDTAPDKVNDMQLASGAKTTWNTWCSEGNLEYPQPITMTWDNPYDISSMRVMWWADNDKTGDSQDGVRFPVSCKAYYYNHATNDWQEITSMQDETGAAISSVGVKGSGTQGNNRTWNSVLFTESIKTTKLKLVIDRPASAAKAGIGIGEWEVYGKEITNEFVGAQIEGKSELLTTQTADYYATTLPSELKGTYTYQWSVPDDSASYIRINGDATGSTVKVEALQKGTAKLNLTITAENGIVRKDTMNIDVTEITSIDEYVTSTTQGKLPILPKTVVANGITFDDPTPSLKSTTNPNFDFGETFDSKLVAVTWDALNAEDFNTVGNVVTVEGTVENTDKKAVAKITVKEKADTPEENTTVTFENVELTDDFWLPKQKTNAVASLNKAISQIEQSSGGEPNFDNAIKKLNGEPYNAHHGYVFSDTDIYKSIEAISYTLSVIHDDTDPEMAAQKAKLEEKIASWIDKIEKVQYADGYINTHFTLRATGYEGGRAPGTHRWRNFNNHEMYNAGHFLEAVVAYTRYREGIGDPDYSLYIAGRRFADHIVNLFGPTGTRHEVPGHEEIELGLAKFAILAEEYEGDGAGDKYINTIKTMVDRRGENYTLRESGYQGYNSGDRKYSQDATPFFNETEAVGHAVRACYLYAGVTDMARMLPDSDPDKAKYFNTLDTLWDSIANRKTYITGGIGVASHGEDFGADYELPNNDSYNEICASIALTNWNQRMNLVYEDAKYIDEVERALYNGILVGVNLDGTKFYYANKLEIPKKGGSTDGGMYGGVQRQDWFTCACCPPNLMRTIAKLSEYMYTTHKDNVYVNLYIGSDGHMNVNGTNVNLKQETKYPWDGAVALTVTPDEAKTFTMNLRIPSWVKDQKNSNVTISVNGKAVDMTENKGYAAITREWKAGDVIRIDMPMEVRKTEADPNVTTNAGKIVLERGPIVYTVEKAGNIQLNSSISNLDPRKYVIPRDANLTAEYNEDLLNGVVEITGDVKYNNGTSVVDAKLQAVPFYASNNRGDSTTVSASAKSTGMATWIDASGEAAKEYTVTFDANGGEAAKESITVVEGGTIGVLPSAEREGYTFDGWFTKASEGEKVTSETVITGNITVYAHWSEKKEDDDKDKDQKAADAVIAKINALGEVTSLDSKAAVEEARAAYDTLTDAQKALVINKKVLETAEAKIKALVEAGNQNNNNGNNNNGGSNYSQPSTDGNTGNTGNTQTPTVPTAPTAESIVADNPALPSGTAEDSKSAVFGELKAKVKTSKATSNKIQWSKVKGADGYVVFGNKCNSKGKKYAFEVLSIIDNNNTTSYTHTGLAKATYYKYLVQAYKMVDGKAQILSTSKTIHAAAKSTKYANVSKLKLNKTNVTLQKKGKTFKVTAKVKKTTGKKLVNHRKVCFESSNPKVATVNSKGVIKAKKKGTCTIYVYAQNGAYQTVKVKVKK